MIRIVIWLVYFYLTLTDRKLEGLQLLIKKHASINKIVIKDTAGPAMIEMGIIEKRMTKKLFIFLLSTINYSKFY